MKKPVFLRAPLAAAILASASAIAVAAPTAWNGSVSNNWFELKNWDDNLVPTNNFAVQISNGDTVQLSGDQPAETKHLYLGLEGEGHLLSNGTDLNATEITLAYIESQATNAKASVNVQNADITAPEGINLMKATHTGDKTVSFKHSNGTLNAEEFDHQADLVNVPQANLNTELELRNVVVNTSTRENILAGDIDVERGSNGSVVNAEAKIGLYDVTWTSQPKLDLEIGSDIHIAPGVENSTINSKVDMTVERSKIVGDWLEFAEYTSARNYSDDMSRNNNIDNQVKAVFRDSDIDLNFRLIMGDVGAYAENSVVKGLADVSFINSTLDVRFDIQLTDIRVEDNSRGEDRAFLRADNSEIRVGDLVEIASYGSILEKGSAVLEAGVYLKDSLLAVNETIQVADVEHELASGRYFFLNADDSLSGELIAESSLITAQTLVAGSAGTRGVVSLKNSYLSLTDTQDADNSGDFNSLDKEEGVLKLLDGNKLVMYVDGRERATASNARNGEGLYSAIDALQVTLDGTLEVNLADNLGKKEAIIDLIRVEKKTGIELGEEAFNGIQGNFDKVVINGLPKKGEATYAIEQETVDGTTYDVYRLKVGGAFSYYAFAFLLVMAGLMRGRKTVK